ALSIDTDWQDAIWAYNHGLYVSVFENARELDQAIDALANKLSQNSPEAMAKLKEVFWEGTEHWETLLEERAAMSGRLVLSDYTSNAIAEFRKRG
ncbi:MAG: enoyl-CoA hydratase/isomerase family protein, partial [candidate division Zixibacteria bacterium]|nr:enoyl-CoA hydratase/isomerase family protein [candidate division KSB1 bacterium]NIR64738.1 enoyl-CoA hydratase/isomerase family protein [candidate division Zixibacteria bacterium]NIW45524.1 enoyl-CoA hydratase/isomerase family protein [Gammaproteobacteria bacterium]NIS46569.1 enoyl-CoA hydratase/isomerase family protein [candidate division Zixibacteria bacterium]NIT71897.1 enoyl-CoA hydratase/isomerase family protein [candidate division KSB1 bacterium]